MNGNHLKQFKIISSNIENFIKNVQHQISYKNFFLILLFSFK